jgi:hypothetical protein
VLIDVLERIEAWLDAGAVAERLVLVEVEGQARMLAAVLDDLVGVARLRAQVQAQALALARVGRGVVPAGEDAAQVRLVGFEGRPRSGLPWCGSRR